MIDGEKIGLLHLNGLQLSDYRISCRSTELPLTYLPCHLLSLSLSLTCWLSIRELFVCTITLTFKMSNYFSRGQVAGIGDRQLMASSVWLEKEEKKERWLV